MQNLHAPIILILILGSLTGIAISFSIGGLVVGGTGAAKGEFPYIVSIRVNGQHICGGAILSPEYILTAAHCCIYSASQYTIVAGEHNLYVSEGTEQARQVVKVVPHEGYNRNTMANDIAIMKVSPGFTLSAYIQPADVAPKGFVAPSTVIVAGWGYTKEGGSGGLPNILQKVSLPLVPNDQCRKNYGNLGYMVTDSTLCAGVAGKDSCQGDSGGPLLCPVNARKVLCGVVSWGVGCGRPNLPGVYTRTSSYQDWIAKNKK